MPKSAKLLQKFDRINRATLKIRVGHSRSGQCPRRLRGARRCTCPQRSAD